MDYKYMLYEEKEQIGILTLNMPEKRNALGREFEEEIIADARLTVATDHKGDIRAMQKGLIGSFSKEEIQKVIKGALDNGQEIRKKLNHSIGK